MARRLPKAAIARVITRIDSLATDPLPPRVVKVSSAERLYRIRVGDYRIVYELDPEDKVITIHYVRHRRDVYRAI